MQVLANRWPVSLIIEYGDLIPHLQKVHRRWILGCGCSGDRDSHSSKRFS